MCTVSFIPGREVITLTSNRDEKSARSAALRPALHPFASGQILFPKDPHAGGTWFAIHENGHAAVLLNGAWQNHVSEAPYRKSRGLVLLQLMDHSSPAEAFHRIALGGIEPFTVVIWENGNLFECRWDARSKYFKELSATQPHIWSSATLYTPEVAHRRASWFRDWLNRNPQPGQDDILNFHRFTGEGDSHNDLLMNRNGQVFTVSITSAEITAEKATVKYFDVRKDRLFRQELVIGKPIPEKK